MLMGIEGYQLSPQQQHLWQLQQTDNPSYRAQCAVAINGNLNTNTLKAALTQIVQQHEILRTTYRYLPGMTIPLQVIVDNSFDWQHHDLSNHHPQEQQAKLEVLFHQFSQHPFNLTQGPVLKLSLVTLSSSQHILFIALPALCADTATLENLVQEISKYYTASIEHEELSDEPLQYADLAAWQNELLQAGNTEGGRDYWRKLDFSALTALQLIFEKQFTEQLEFSPQTYTFKIDPALAAKIDNLTHQSNASLSDFFLACWNVLLWRITGQQNLIIGVASDGRKYQELKAALGLLSKYLPIYTELKEEFTFNDILQKVQETLTTAYNYEDYFHLEIADLPQNTPPFLPLAFEFVQPQKYQAGDVSFSIYEQYACSDRFKIKLACVCQENSINVNFTYDANLFLVEDIKRLAGQFQTLVESAIGFAAPKAIAHPDEAISQLQILSEIEQQQLLFEFNNTKLDYSINKCIHQLFEERVASTPNKVAIVIAQEQLTYKELNSRANKIARYLQQLGVGAEVLVGLCVERTPMMILGILAILKAGGAYVPLDPAYPKERLAFMLQDSQPRVLLTQSLLAELPEHTAQVVCLDTNWHFIAQQPEDNLEQTADPANLAYVIYTSGSTGTPKGVRVTHANLCHYVQAMQIALGITAEDIYLHTASIAFSSSVRQFMVPLTKGATVKIATSEQRKDPRALFVGIKQHNVTVIDIVPSYWRNCNHTLASLEPELRKTLLDNKLRLIVSASEPLLSDIPSTWRFDFQHSAQFINMFGQTETCGIVATYPIPVQEDEPMKVVPLGRPIANTQIYLLDQHLQPVPIGVAGEVYIGGLGLGQGYLHRPDLTAEKFIPNPYSNQPGARLYKTGDLGRYLPDGTIEFIGRSDYQVKIRGFRIELAEIEAVLGQHPDIREAVVLAREDAGNKRLVAYVVPNNVDSLQNSKSSDLARFLQEKLPDYMLPSSFVMLEALPLTPNGKVNRSALPAPEQVRLETIATPRTPVEEVLVGIWVKILNIQQVGINDNFFELGGHSLLATQVISQVREAFQVELPLRSLFESPTVAGLGDRIETALRSGQKLEVPPIERVARDGELPLSFAQQRLWFLDQLQPGSASYNLSRAVRLQGTLNVAALEQSFNEIVRRHEVLRTTFTAVDGQPVQVIAPTLSIKMPVVDLRELPQDAREAETQRLAKLEAQRSFDLTTGPLLNATLLQLAEEEYVLLFTMHHIVADGWSAGVIVREVAELYTAYCRDVASESSTLLPELPIQYADFAVWQRQWLQKEVLASQMEYWKQQLSGSLPVLELPTDRPRPAIQTFAGKKQSFQLSPTLSEALKTLSQREGVTLFMTLLAAFNTLLYRYTQQEDILVGSPIANRNRSEIEGLIGFFVNTLVLRTNLEGNPSFRELLKRVREVTLGAYAHQDLPFEQLVEELHPERNLSHTPLFQVMFALQNAPSEALKLPGLSLNFLEADSETARFDLSLSLTDTAQGLIGELEYNTDLFDSARVTRMLGYFQNLLESIVAHPDQSLSDLTNLTQAEQQQLLVEWNNTQADYPFVCIHQLFEAQVERTPDAVAVVFEDLQLTYQQLNARANQLAHHLQKLGVRPEVLVGICVERSLEMVIGLLAILKAGGAYLPLDPLLPKERKAFMLADAQVRVLLTQQNLATSLEQHQAQVVCIDRDWENIAAHNQNNPISGVQPENLAYIIYTSGSTGQPKGVQITHRSVVNFLTTMQQQPGLTEEDTLLAVTTLSFDIAGLEIFLPLLVGARVVVASRLVATDGIQLSQQLSDCGATVMQATPATWRMLLEAGWQGSPQLKILCGGEALQRQLAVQLQQLCASIWNLYGPTETTIWSTIYQVDHREGPVPIGRAIANTQIYILDRHLQPVPIGVPGELYIGGAGLARGYLHREELTAEKFIPNPFSEKSELLYKTGDLACYLSDRSIEYKGRIDHQVKLRGFRIELGEIETLLNQHAAVRETVVIVREDRPGDQRLVAYIVPNGEFDTRLIAQLRQFLQQKLPEYMVPSAFVMLEAMPLTPNGKVNRRALPTPDITHSHPESGFVAPRNPIEEAIAKIWVQVLGVELFGIHDNFFTLGGHSLLATQVISRIRKTFEVDLPLHRLFESPTVAELAKTIQEVMKVEPLSATPPIMRVSRDGNLPLSFAQQRLWLLEQLYPGSSMYNIPVAVRLVGSLNVAVLEQSLNEIVRRHEVLRTTFAMVDEHPVQAIALQRSLRAIAPSLNLNLSILDLRELPEQEREAQVQNLSAEEFQRPFDLAQGPLLRCSLLRVGEQEHIILFSIHHIVSDGWSMGVFVRELATLYEAFSLKKPSPLPELPIQYADFAVWQRQLLQKEVLQTQLQSWKQQLGNNLPVLQLPTTRPRAEVKTNRGATQTFVIPPQESAALQTLSQQEGVTLFMTLLAGFQVLLQRYTNQDDIVVGTDVANRNQAELEPLIGFFVNLLVLRTDLSENPSFRELLKRVRQVTLKAYAHQDLPFEELVKALQPERNLSQTPPLFQVLFVLQNAPMPALELPELTLNLLPVDNKIARFDLALFLTETEQGIMGKWQYNADLFDDTTITRMTRHFQTLLNSIVTQPDARLSALEMLTETERKQQVMQKSERKAFKREKFINVAPKAVNLSQEQLIKTDYLQPGQTFPLVIQPQTDEIDLKSWAKNNQEFIERQLLKHGAILFRGFHVNSVSDFENFASAICPNLFGEYGDLPRAGEGGKVYGSTPYPADKAILFHNESSHLHRFPLKIWFFCVQPAQQGGETPIVDCRKAYQILNPKLREQLAEKQLMYVRNYTEGLDVSWQDFFQTTEKSVVENYCIQAKIDFEWYENNELITRQIRPALAGHPKTGEPVFFNQIQLHHVAYLDVAVRESLLSLFGEQKLPRNVYYGDVTPIEDSVIAEINEVYRQSTMSFPWMKGDILMLDNMLTAHGRYPYVGQRKIVVAMGEMINGENIVKPNQEEENAK
ncbi:non-ribosomal peptide synthetase [Mastigocladopsis repens]|uniref:non-ribosomal peptide synthetase n=1 Tax=Mastigocladopsis repens TaxID=221287 RepID=UPI000317F2B2|nr:non-ribosomal peptide synthetase [Mastigocladopsis repens]